MTQAWKIEHLCTPVERLPDWVLDMHRKGKIIWRLDHIEVHTPVGIRMAFEGDTIVAGPWVIGKA